PDHRGFLLIGALSVYLLPALPVLFRDGREFCRRFFSTVLPEFWRSILAALFRIAAIPSAAVSSVWGILRSGGKDRKGKAISDPILILMLFPASLLCGLLLLRIRGWMRLLGMIWIFFPPFLLLWDKILPTAVMSRAEREELNGYAERTWRYFESIPDALPPFGVQLAPYPMTWDYTTPATLGLSALAGLAAYDLKQIDAHTLIRRSANQVNALARLPKKKGLFYEKYHTDQPELYGSPTVRTDEIGILTVSLFCLQIGLTELTPASGEEEELRDRTVGQIGEMLSAMDFSLLSCEDKPCLRSYVTSSGREIGEPCDRFASGDLLTLFFGVCFGKLPENYLDYPEARLIERGGYLGYRSAHGGLDDYLLPYLFLPLAKRSLAYEGSHFALLSQMSAAGRQKRRIWGSGEGDCFAFDDLHRPIPVRGGDPSLAEMPADADTVHPYTSFLAGSLLPRRSLANLRRQVRMGAYGVYGFYEAVDFAKERVGSGYAVTEGYRTAHQALILISLANLLCGRPFERRLMSDPRIASRLSLLIRPIPKSPSAPIKASTAAGKTAAKKIVTQERDLNLAVIGDPFLSAVVSDAGHFQLLYKGSTVNRLCFDPRDPAETGESLRLFASVGERTFNAMTGELSVGERQLCLHADRMGLITKTTLKRLSDPLPVWSLMLRADGDPGRFTAALMLCLSADRGDRVESMPGMNLILVKKGDRWIGIGSDSPACFCDLFTDPRLLPYGYGDRDLYDLLDKAEPKSKSSPANILFGAVRLKRMGRGPLGFRILLSESRSELLRIHKISLSLTEDGDEILHAPTENPLELWMLSACLFSGRREIAIHPSDNLPSDLPDSFRQCAEGLSRRGFFCKVTVVQSGGAGLSDGSSDARSVELSIGKEDSIREICSERIRITDRPAAPTDPAGSERLYGNRKIITCLTPHSLGFTLLCDPRLPITSPPFGAFRPFTGEQLTAVRDGRAFPLFSRVSGCLFTDECAIYKTEDPIGGRILVGCDPDLPVKLILTDHLAIDTLEADIRPFGSDTLPRQIRTVRDEDTRFYKNSTDGRTVYVCKRSFGRDCGILIGSYRQGCEREYYAVLDKFRTADDFRDAFAEYGSRCREDYEGITRTDGLPDADFVRQAHLWSIFSSFDRFSSFLFLLYYRPDAFREQMIRFACETQACGDYSPDHLELVYGCGLYLQMTDDREVLSLVLPYQGGVYRESLYLHLIRILEGSDKKSADYARAAEAIAPYLPADELESFRTPPDERQSVFDSVPPLCKSEYADYLRMLADRQLGLKIYPDHFTLSPSPIRHPVSYELRIRGCHYTLRLSPGDENLFRIDGKIVNNYFSYEKSEVLLEITVAKFKKKV
ncbi:MAG: hypothetical protein ACI3XR_09810, partial [Eubacteriales bacterium]